MENPPEYKINSRIPVEQTDLDDILYEQIFKVGSGSSSAVSLVNFLDNQKPEVFDDRKLEKQIPSWERDHFNAYKIGTYNDVLENSKIVTEDEFTLRRLKEHLKAKTEAGQIFDFSLVYSMAHYFLILKKDLQNYKIEQSQYKGDIGLKKTVNNYAKKKTTSNLFSKLKPKNEPLYCPTTEEFQGMVFYNFNEMKENQTVLDLKNKINWEQNKISDELDTIPLFIFNDAFQEFVKNNQEKYCGNVCKSRYQCGRAARFQENYEY